MAQVEESAGNRGDTLAGLGGVGRGGRLAARAFTYGRDILGLNELGCVDGVNRARARLDGCEDEELVGGGVGVHVDGD